jgi:hypothetical protein
MIPLFNEKDHCVKMYEELVRKKEEELIETENDKDDHKENFIQNLPQALPTKFQLI